LRPQSLRPDAWVRGGGVEMKIDMSLREEGFHLCTKLRMEAHVCEYVLRAVPEDVIEETLDVQNEEGCDVACFDAGFCVKKSHVTGR